MSKLLSECNESFPSAILPVSPRRFEPWLAKYRERIAADLAGLLTLPVGDWVKFIQSSTAANHPWYSYFETDISLDRASQFLAEEALMPGFVSLLKRVQFSFQLASLQGAVQRNLVDELKPGAVHAQLFDRMLSAVQSRRAAAPLNDDVLADTNLLFYAGYYESPLMLVGALWATELMLPRRTKCLAAGLRRLGFSADEYQFMTIHSECDGRHADDWLKQVVMPLINLDPKNARPIAQGILLRLKTSALYLDRCLGDTRGAGEWFVDVRLGLTA